MYGIVNYSFRDLLHEKYRSSTKAKKIRRRTDQISAQTKLDGPMTKTNQVSISERKVETKKLNIE